jgi:hypothetical protein
MNQSAWDLGGFILLLLVGANLGFTAGQSKEIKATRFMTVNSLTVKDYVFGEEVDLELDATVHADFLGTWHIQIKSENGVIICNQYGRTDSSGSAIESGRLFSGWINKKQDLCLPGVYPLYAGCYTVTLTVEVPGVSPELVTRVHSNKFCVGV